MKKTLIFSLVCVLSLAVTTAQAEWVLSWDVTPNAATAIDGTTSLDLIVGTVDAGAGGLVDALDFDLTGTLYQHWYVHPALGDIPTMFLDAGVARDTQLLVAQAQTVEGKVVVEDNDGTQPTGPYDKEGWGTGFSGAVGYRGEFQLQEQPFIQMYIESGTVVTYEILGSGFAPQIGEVPNVPEPSMLCLLGLGSLAMLLIRRK